MKSDIFVFERPHTKGEVASLLAVRAHCGVRLVMDIDDDICSVHEGHAAYEAYRDRPPEERYNVIETKDLVYAELLRSQGYFIRREGDIIYAVKETHTDYVGNFQAMAREVDAITTTTPIIKELYSDLNSNIHILPNCIDFAAWDKLERGKNEHVTIGWAGSAAHKPGLEMIEKPMLAVLKRHKRAAFSLMGLDCPFTCPSGRIEGGSNRWTHINHYPKELAKLGFDIGIAPLLDIPFNHAKSNLRWLEYSALGIPSVCSPMTEFVGSIEDGETGFLAENDHEWEQSLNMLVRDEGMRHEMGTAAQEAVRAGWCQEKNISAWADVYREVVS